MTEFDAEKCCEEMRAENERMIAEWNREAMKQFEPIPNNRR